MWLVLQWAFVILDKSLGSFGLIPALFFVCLFFKILNLPEEDIHSCSYHFPQLKNVSYYF